MKTIHQTIKIYGTAAERAVMVDKDVDDNTEILFTETDTGDSYIWDGDSWNQATAAGTMLVDTKPPVAMDQAAADLLITNPDGTGYTDTTPKHTARTRIIITDHSTNPGEEFEYNYATSAFVLATGNDGSGNIKVSLQNQNPVPEYQVFEWEGAATAASDNAVIYATPIDNYAYDTFMFSNDSAVAVSVQVKVHPSSAWSADVAVHQFNNATAPPIVAIAAGVSGYLKGRFYQIQIISAAATAIGAGEVNGTLSNSGGGQY